MQTRCRLNVIRRRKFLDPENKARVEIKSKTSQQVGLYETKAPSALYRFEKPGKRRHSRCLGLRRDEAPEAVVRELPGP